MSATIPCEGCGKKRRVKNLERARRLCYMCSDTPALVGGSWQLIPGRGTRRWVPYENTVIGGTQ